MTQNTGFKTQDLTNRTNRTQDFTERTGKTENKKLKGQSMLLTITLVILILVAGFAFLASTILKPERNEEYNRLFASNLLTSLLKTDTGYTDFPDKCKTVADILLCAHDTPSFKCGSDTCANAVQKTDLYLSKSLTSRPNLDYYFKYGTNEFGNKKIAGKDTAIQQRTRITKGSSILDVVLYIGDK